MSRGSMQPFGEALLHFARGVRPVLVYIVRDDGLREPHPIDYYFRGPEEFSALEKKALSLCRGRILDIGAGAGAHALELQQRGMDVAALDIAEGACQTMRDRGVQRVIEGTIYDIPCTIEPKYDILLLLGISIGFVGDLAGLTKFLGYAQCLLSEGGQLIFDGRDIRSTRDEVHRLFQKANQKGGRYFGEIRFQIEYQGNRGGMYKMLQVDPDKLAEICSQTGWALTILEQSGSMYLVQLTVK